ncbi:FAD-dependent monooxygenase [Reinekea marinisedimentorum]|uniref:2-octaprenyl-6-methoxyphenol hydroxylase n=1 Tax=Reinekea marinisedimentorum TaxID=230495 RepID=A0A4R3IC90_9GAMM|nr:FAD-dependent monooxygenase [Reinekea marinisedimentorum]TCS43176.1 2-octaprenyl-6-methoxyphenol hydroxylase [Reinekea marinisedimentorum]
MEQFDLAIIGGGMSGLTLLSALRKSIFSGLTVTLIDPADRPVNSQLSSPSFDDRATALSEQTLRIFNALALPGIERTISNITEIEVSDRGHAGSHQMLASDMGFTRYGAVIANKALGTLLWQQVKDLPVDWRFNSEAQQLKPLQNGQQISLSDGRVITARQIILCDGGRSDLTTQLGLGLREKHFNARARIATVTTREPHHGKAFERFTPTGPIALLPFGRFSALVWTVPEDNTELLEITPKAAIEWLNTHLCNRLGGISQISDWYEYPLIQKTLSTSCIHGLVATGNSAATLHPVAGQGFNLAIRGIARLAALINRHYTEQAELPGFHDFQQVCAEIEQDQQKTVGFSGELIRLFGSQSPLLQLGRNLGLGSLDRHPSFSKAFALGSMGLLESVPLEDICYHDKETA